MDYYISTYLLSGKTRKIKKLNEMLNEITGFVVSDSNLPKVIELAKNLSDELNKDNKGRKLRYGTNGMMIYFGFDNSDAWASVNFYPIKGEFLGYKMVNKEQQP